MSVDVALIVLGASILALGLPSNIVKRLWLSVPLLALVGACCSARRFWPLSSPIGCTASTRFSRR